MPQKTIHRTVKTDGIAGTLVTPAGKGPFPAVLCIGGSSGGISTEVASPMAAEGFAALALGYFGASGLPDTFANLPMEYFERALGWLLHQPEVQGQKVGVTGTSRGSEAALQLASLSPKVGAVVVYVPSGIRWMGVDGQPSWTYRNSPLPYIQWPNDFDGQGAIAKVDRFNQVLDNPAQYKDSVIEVEQASCPILLISGEDDQLWPSKRMAKQIIERLKQHNYRWSYRHITYPSAGHRIKVPGLDSSRYEPVSEDTVTHEILSLGGTLEGNRSASVRAWAETVYFFQAALKK